MALEERSAGFILYTWRDGVAHYLLLDYGKHWDFPKGHVEPGESDVQAALRELKEETGLRTISIAPEFSKEVVYFFRHKSRGLIRKTVVLFLAHSEQTEVLLSDEHTSHLFLPLKAALNQVTFASARQILQAAGEWLAAQPVIPKG